MSAQSNSNEADSQPDGVDCSNSDDSASSTTGGEPVPPVCANGHWCRRANQLMEEDESGVYDSHRYVTRRSDHMWYHIMAIMLWAGVIQRGIWCIFICC